MTALMSSSTSTEWKADSRLERRRERRSIRRLQYRNETVKIMKDANERHEEEVTI